MKLTKAQHFVAFFIVLPAVLLAAPFLLTRQIARWVAAGSDVMGEWVGGPFLRLERLWVARCNRVNSAPTALKDPSP